MYSYIYKFISINARLQNTLRRAAKFAGARTRTLSLSHKTHKHTSNLYHPGHTARGELQKKCIFAVGKKMHKKCTKNAQHFFAVVHARARNDILI